MNLTAKITYDHEIVTRMITEAVAAEREACAKVCDAEALFGGNNGRKEAGASNCADAIRARGNQ